MRMRLSLFLVTLLSGMLFRAGSAAPPAVPQTIEELKELRLKQLYRREPRAKEYVPAVEKKIAEMKQQKESTGAVEDKLNEAVMNAGALSEDKLRYQVDFLADLAGPSVRLSNQDKDELKSRYAKLCADVDDQIFVKDLNDTLQAHDRLIDHVACQLWDKQKISSELDRLEESIQKAPPIPYGRQELLRSLQDKKVTPQSKGCYVGVSSRHNRYLSTFRPSVAVLEESTGSIVPIDSANLTVPQTLSEMRLFEPPLILWMKCRLLEGHIPAVTFNLADSGSQIEPATGADKSKKAYGVQDILDGKLDDYFTSAFKLIAASKAAALVGLIGDFDREADSAFGADGKTPYYLLVDPKLAAMPESKRGDEVARRLAKGALVKDAGAELRKYYGDKNIPDGPERVRDAWKHLRSLATAAGAQCVSLFSCAAPSHGNKKALATDPLAGAQEWNKLEYYWPGEAVLDWVGVSNASIEFGKGKPAAGGDQLEQFILEARNSNWNSTPVLLESAMPSHREPLSEDKWISACFQEMLPAAYPEIKACILLYPEQLTLWSPDALAAFRRCVASNQSYKVKPRLVPAEAPQTSSSH